MMPQWPSMLASSHTHSNYQPPYPQPVQSIPPISVGSLQTPVSATSTRSATTPRKTLTDLDRKRMCQYAEEHPTSKQTEIGAIFGVERSTVSKVLRQKEKYLFQDDGSRSPAKRPKGRSPDIERTLAVWAKNQEKKGNPLTDELIKQQARAFMATTTNPDDSVVLSSSWIEKFKLKNNLMGARSRKASLATDDLEAGSGVQSSSHSPSGGLGSPSPVELRSVQSNDSLKNESPDDYIGFGARHGPFHSQSANSLHSAFTDTAPSSFSPAPLSPTSPFFTPDSGTAPSSFVPQLASRPLQPNASNSNSHRSRSQTFPQVDQYMTSGEAVASKYGDDDVLDSPMEEAPMPPNSLNETMGRTMSSKKSRDERVSTVSPSETMRPPPLPAHRQSSDSVKRESNPPTNNNNITTTTTPEEARRALEVVLSFFKQQPNGFLDFNESVTIGKLMEKLKLHNPSGSNA